MSVSVRGISLINDDDRYVRYPDAVVLEGIEAEVTPEPKPEDDDFFTTWDKPLTPLSSSSPSPKPTTPVISRSATPAIAPNPAPAPSLPRTVTSSSLRVSSAGPAAGLGARRSVLAASSSTGAAGSKKTKLGGLGSIKKAAPIDFAEAERKAAEEAERIKQLGYDRQRKEEEEKARQQAEKAKNAADLGRSTKKILNGSTSTVNKFTTEKPKGNPADLERLGMASKRLGFGATLGAGSEAVPSISRKRSAQPTISRLFSHLRQLADVSRRFPNYCPRTIWKSKSYFF